jgi:hypothetical protein
MFPRPNPRSYGKIEETPGPVNRVPGLSCIPKSPGLRAETAVKTAIIRGPLTAISIPSVFPAISASGCYDGTNPAYSYGLAEDSGDRPGLTSFEVYVGSI